jgi:ribosomal protein L11 methyltransferase
VIRLGIRVRAADAEVAFARLEPVLAAGAEEVALGEEVEFAIYEDVPDVRLRALYPDLLAIAREPVAEGWERAWHEHLAPVTVGALTIRPPWLPGAGLVIDPGETFGLASHPTTRLCLELLQELPRTPLADWGTGCGVLAVAAAHLGYAPVTAIELDPAAVATARANGVDAHVGDVLADPPLADTVVANLTLPLLEALPVKPPTLIASGFLAGRRVRGLVERERRELDGWAAIVA